MVEAFKWFFSFWYGLRKLFNFKMRYKYTLFTHTYLVWLTSINKDRSLFQSRSEMATPDRPSSNITLPNEPCNQSIVVSRWYSMYRFSCADVTGTNEMCTLLHLRHRDNLSYLRRRHRAAIPVSWHHRTRPLVCRRHRTETHLSIPVCWPHTANISACVDVIQPTCQSAHV